jgi:hypothetical protein
MPRLPTARPPIPANLFASENVVVPIDDLLVLRDRYPNVLIVGPGAAAAAALSEIYPLLRLPITSLRIDHRVALPLTLTHGSLILRNVAALPLAQQERLHDWLARTAGSTQVLATSTTALYPLVERGAFLDVLYYRLNMTYLEVGGR